MNQKLISSEHEAAERIQRELGAEKIRLLRNKAKNDLFFLANTILGYDLLSPKLHGHFASWYKKTINRQFRLNLQPRGHFKTTLATKADTIQIVLPDDMGTSPYPRNLGTNCRIAIIHEVADQASEILTEIANHFTSNALLIALFPECKPGKQNLQNKSELELPRTKFWSEPTISAMGIGSAGQGKHYNYLKLDDIYGVAARDSETVHMKTIRWINNMQSYLLTPKSDFIDISGTRYKHGDGYAHIIEIYGNQLVRYHRAAEEWDEELEKKVPIFPEQFSPESFLILKKDPIVWNSQYMNDPISGESEFDIENERRYERVKWEDPDHRKIVYFSEEKSKSLHWLELDRLIFIDPATVGESGITVTGTNSERNPKVFLLDCEQRPYKSPDLINKIFQLVRKWEPRAVIIEEVLFSELYRHWLSREMQMRKHYFKVIGAKTRGRKKEDRVRALLTWYSNAQIWYHDTQVDMIDQTRKFPGIREYHMLDSLAYGPQFWRSSTSEIEKEKVESAIEMIRRTRDPVTGYSRINRGSKNNDY